MGKGGDPTTDNYMVMTTGLHLTQDPISTTEMSPALSGNAYCGAQVGPSVRRLTPRECERLQGFPDDWTAECSDSARYKMLGNAVAVPVVQWIARRARRAIG